MSAVKDQELNESIERRAKEAEQEDETGYGDGFITVDEMLSRKAEANTDQPSEPIRLETEDVFNPDLLGRPDPEFLSETDAFMDNPMAAIMKPLIQYFEAIKPKPLELPKSEHKVRIFRLNDRTVLAEVEAAIEAFLNEGYCCHIPTVCNDFLIMDFSRRKESEEDATIQH